MTKQEVADSRYFSTLPKFIQESIMQSGLEFKSEEEIKKFVSQLESK